MAAVSFNDVWEDNFIMTQKVSSPAAVIPSATSHGQPSKAISKKSAKLSHVHRKKKVKFSEDVDTDSSSSETEDTDVDEPINRIELQQLLRELKDMKEENNNQQTINTTILYTSVAIIIILLVMMYHTSQKLHYTTDVLLWHLKSKGI